MPAGSCRLGLSTAAASGPMDAGRLGAVLTQGRKPRAQTCPRSAGTALPASTLLACSRGEHRVQWRPSATGSRHALPGHRTCFLLGVSTCGHLHDVGSSPKPPGSSSEPPGSSPKPPTGSQAPLGCTAAVARNKGKSPRGPLGKEEAL